jgi:acetyl esterase/lipase
MTDPFDPELGAIARWLPRPTMNDSRAHLVRRLARWMPVPASSRDVVVEARTVAGVRSLVFRPRAAKGPRPGLLWLHGGGYVIGTPEREGARCRALAASHDAVVVPPAYRLAPEHPFPAARDDAHRVLVAMSEDASLGVRADRIAIAGVSAGGGHAASLALQAREHGPRVVAQILIYPMLDDRTTSRHDVDDAPHRLWN